MLCGLLRAIHFLQLNWQQLAKDMAELLTFKLGTSSPKYSNQIMNSRSFIVKECENQNWEGIITRIWPNTKYLDVIVTGM